MGEKTAEAEAEKPSVCLLILSQPQAPVRVRIGSGMDT